MDKETLRRLDGPCLGVNSADGGESDAKLPVSSVYYSPFPCSRYRVKSRAIERHIHSAMIWLMGACEAALDTAFVL